jgi:hypothetical protein
MLIKYILVADCHLNLFLFRVFLLQFTLCSVWIHCAYHLLALLHGACSLVLPSKDCHRRRACLVMLYCVYATYTANTSTTSDGTWTLLGRKWHSASASKSAPPFLQSSADLSPNPFIGSESTLVLYLTGSQRYQSSM